MCDNDGNKIGKKLQDHKTFQNVTIKSFCIKFHKNQRLNENAL